MSFCAYRHMPQQTGEGESLPTPDIRGNCGSFTPCRMLSIQVLNLNSSLLTCLTILEV